jgi:hypothetical protein
VTHAVPQEHLGVVEGGKDGKQAQPLAIPKRGFCGLVGPIRCEAASKTTLAEL